MSPERILQIATKWEAQHAEMLEHGVKRFIAMAITEALEEERKIPVTVLNELALPHSPEWLLSGKVSEIAQEALKKIYPASKETCPECDQVWNSDGTVHKMAKVWCWSCTERMSRLHAGDNFAPQLPKVGKSMSIELKEKLLCELAGFELDTLHETCSKIENGARVWYDVPNWADPAVVRSLFNTLSGDAQLTVRTLFREKYTFEVNFSRLDDVTDYILIATGKATK